MGDGDAEEEAAVEVDAADEMEAVVVGLLEAPTLIDAVGVTEGVGDPLGDEVTDAELDGVGDRVGVIDNDGDALEVMEGVPVIEEEGEGLALGAALLNENTEGSSA